MTSVDKRLLFTGQLLRWVQIVFYSGLILYLTRSILIPVSFSILISFVLYPVCEWLERKGIGRLGAIVIALLLLMLILCLLMALLVYQLIGFVNEWPSLHVKVTTSLDSVSGYLSNIGISRRQQEDFLNSISSDSGKDFLGLITKTIRVSITSAVMLVLIPVYAILILYYRTYWIKVLHRIFPRESTSELNRLVALTIKAWSIF